MPGRLEHVHEGEVPAELAGVFRDIRLSMRTTYVPLLFRALAVHRGALKAVWRQLRPNVVTRAFEDAADELRTVIVNEAVNLHTPLIEPVLASVGFDVDELDELRSQVRLFHYTDPKVLLCAVALRRAVEGHRVGGASVPPELLAPLPPLPADDMPELALLPEEPGGVTGEVFHRIMETTHLPIATTDLRALGHWPAFIEAAWDEIGPIFRDPRLESALAHILREASRRADRLPFAIALDDEAIGEAARPSITRVVNVMADAMPRLALFVGALEVGFDGAQDALDSPYPVDWEEQVPELPVL